MFVRWIIPIKDGEEFSLRDERFDTLADARTAIRRWGNKAVAARYLYDRGVRYLAVTILPSRNESAKASLTW